MSQSKKNEFDEGIEILPGIWYGGTEQLAQEKVEARMRLLSMPPEEAQKLVDMTLYPQYWEFSLENYTWEESIPAHWGEDDDEAQPDK